MRSGAGIVIKLSILGQRRTPLSGSNKSRATPYRKTSWEPRETPWLAAQVPLQPGPSPTVAEQGKQDRPGDGGLQSSQEVNPLTRMWFRSSDHQAGPQ